MNNLEMEIYKKLIENKGIRDEEIYLMTFELMKDDEEKEEKIKKLLENKVLKQIQQIFGRQSAEGNLEESDFISWIKYLYFNELND